MPIDPTLAQRAAANWKVPKPRDDFARPRSLDDQIKDLPGSEKLTPFERGVYKVLPGISQSWFGQKMAEIDKNPIGHKIFQALDYLAEGAERTIGLAAQWGTYDVNDMDDLRAAWYAGSLSYETLNLPTFRRDANGKINGFTIPNDLPGLSGMLDSRQKWEELVSQGIDPDEALLQVKQGYFDSLGALAIRAQLYDTYGHILLDPLNVLGAAIKPVELLQARRISAITGKIAYTAEELTTEAARISKLAKAAGTAEEAAQLTREAELLTSTAAKVASGEYKGLNLLDKAAIMLTGGDPFNPSKAAKFLEKTPLKLFQLTPESKARELMTLIGDNIGTTMINRLWNEADAETQFVNAMNRIEKGSTGIEFGHALVSTEGRTAQAFIKGSATKVRQLHNTYMAVADERNFLKVLADTLGDNSYNILKSAKDNPDALLRQIANKGDPTLAAMIQNGELTVDSLGGLASKLKDIPLEKSHFFAAALDAMEEHAMRQAVVQFGVKARGAVTRWSDAIKSAESLAFLRLNPAYPIRNVVNNDITMMARGVFGMMTPGQIDDYLKQFPMAPVRAAEGFGPEAAAGIMKFEGSAEDVLAKALEGGNYGTPEKVKEFFQKFNLGKLDTAGWGRKLEQASSKRAWVVGHQQFTRKYVKPPKVSEFMDSKTFDEVEKLVPGLSREIENAYRSAGTFENKFDDFMKSNLNLNTDSVLDEAGNIIGSDVREMMGDEVLEFLHQRLPEAVKSGTTEKVVLEARQMIEKHIDDLFQKQLENVVEHVKAQTMAGGPQAYYKYMGEAQDIFWSAHTEHAVRTPEAARLAREAANAKDFKLANTKWTQIDEDSARFFDRAFKRVDAYLEGMEGAAKELKLPFPKEVRGSFGQWKGMWEDFFSTTRAERRAFFDARLKGKEFAKRWDELTAGWDKAYQAAIAKEDELMQRIDDVVANQISDPQARQAFMNTRDAMAELRRTNKQKIIETRAAVEQMPTEARQAVWDAFWKEQMEHYTQMRDLDAAGRNIMQGDPNTTAMFSQVPTEPTRTGGTIYDIANEYGIPSASPSGARNDRRILATVNKYAPDGQKFKNAADIPEDVARQAFETRAAEKGTQVPAKQISQQFIGEVGKVIPDPMPVDLGQDLMVYGRTYGALDAVVDGAKSQATKTPMVLDKLPPELKNKVMSAMEQMKGQMSTDRYAATRFANMRRDSALLNYNRRTHFDAMIGNVYPFAFWTTGSVQKWAIESIDRPAMLTTYLRMRNFMNSSGLQRDGMPSRIKGSLRVNLPFVPDWMGEQFVDPLRMLLPFDSFIQPFAQQQQAMSTAEGRAQRILEDKLQSGEISQREYEDAIDGKDTPLWDQTLSEVQQNDDNMKFDAFDFATTMSSPHAPIMWAYNAARGHPEDIGPFSPMSRLMRNTATMLGVEDYNNSPYNIEGKIRKSLGLPAYDKFDRYRVNRSISNLAGNGDFSLDEVKEARYLSDLVQAGKMTEDEAKQRSEAYREGVRRANQEYTGGALGYAGNLLGFNVKTVPQGETNLRALSDDFSRAFAKYDKANASLEKFLGAHPELDQNEASDLWEKQNPKLAQDAGALTDFFEAHPEYETRLGLFDPPEKQMKKFQIDQVWEKWNSYPKINQDEIKDQLGPEFAEAFLNKETRSYDAITPEQLSVWLTLMRSDVPGTLSATEKALLSLNGLKLTNPEKAWRAQSFYDIRKEYFGNYYELQNEYFAISDKKKRKAYLKENPELKSYWSWRNDFLMQNADVANLLTDDEKLLGKIQKQPQTGQFTVPDRRAIEAQLSPTMREIMQLSQGETLPDAVERELEYLAARNGLTLEQVRGILGF